MDNEEGRALFEETKLRLSPPQIVLLFFVILTAIGLAASTFQGSSISLNHAKTLAEGETHSAAVIFSQRETLVYTTKLSQWAAGEIPRRDVQIARALLAQRLSVIDQSGKSVGQSVSPEYLQALKAGDALIAKYGPGTLSEAMHTAAGNESLKIVDTILSTARTFVVDYQQSIDDELVITAKDRQRTDQRSLTLLFLLIALIAIFVGWVGYSTRSQYLRSRRAIRREIVLLEKLQSDLVIAQEKVTQLRSLNEAKNEFISTVNHELRTPLTSIIGYSDLLMMELQKHSGPETQKLLTYVQKNAALLLELVESMLSLSKLDSGVEVSHDDEVDLIGVIEGVIFVLELDAANKSLDMRLICDEPNKCRIIGNENQLSQVFINLISNAIKFSPVGLNIDITVGLNKNGMVEVTVKDYGVGIPAEDIPKLFQRFFRARNVTDSQFPGTGLGLEIVSRIVALHGGKVEVDSVEGQGSTFTVSLPRSLDPVERLIQENKMGVLQRSIELIEAASFEEIPTVLHTVGGTLPFYTFETEGRESSAILSWLREGPEPSESEIKTRVDALLLTLKSKLAELFENEITLKEEGEERIDV